MYKATAKSKNNPGDILRRNPFPLISTMIATSIGKNI